MLLRNHCNSECHLEMGKIGNEHGFDKRDKDNNVFERNKYFLQTKDESEIIEDSVFPTVYTGAC